MMKHKWIIITLCVIFFLTGLTFYLNRIILPQIVKKIAIEQASNYLKRTVEIESIHFNWIRGIMVNKFKVYQKDSSEDVLIQAERISTGIVFIPGWGKHKLILPSITVESPSLHLIHQDKAVWNFSDLVAAAAPATTAEPSKPSPIDVTIGGIKITNGKIRLDDLQSAKGSGELIDQLNARIGLSLAGISFDSSLSIPQKQANLAVKGLYAPLNKNLKAQINIQNLKPGDYLIYSPIDLPLSLTDGIIKNIAADIEYSPETIFVKGQWSLQDIDLKLNDINLKANVEANHAEISIKNNTYDLKGNFEFNKIFAVSKDYLVKGSINSAIDEFHYLSQEDFSVKGKINSDLLKISLKDKQRFEGKIDLTIDQGRWKKNIGSIQGQLFLKELALELSPQEKLNGDLELTNLKLTKDTLQTNLQADLVAKDLNVNLLDKFVQGNITARHLNVNLAQNGDIKLSSALNLENTTIKLDKTNASGQINFDQIDAFLQNQEQMLSLKTKGQANNLNVDIGNQSTTTKHAVFDLDLKLPLKNPKSMTYEGSLEITDASLQGLPFGPVEQINLKTNITTDTADIKSLSLHFLDTPLEASGHIKNFEKPVVDIEAQSQRIDLGKLKTVAPDLLKTHGLIIDGESSFQIKYQGPIFEPSLARINAKAQLKNVNIESTKLKQNLQQVSGTFIADGNSLSWEDLSGIFMEKTFTLTGQLNDFKNPHLVSTLSNEFIDLQADIQKNDTTVTINKLNGHYLSAAFNVIGSVDLSNKTPSINIKNSLKFKLEDLEIFLPDLKKTLSPLKLSGLINIDSQISGLATDWQHWQSNTKITSDSLVAMGLTFNNVILNASQSEGKIQELTLDTDSYQGTIQLNSTIDLLDKNFPSLVNIKIANVDVASVLKEFKVPQDIRGKFNLDSRLKLDLLKPLDVSGHGSTAILEAYLADIELFKGILSPLRTIIPTSNLILNEVAGSFDIASQKVTTEDLQIKGNIMNLLSKGWVAFDQTLDMHITVPDEINQTSPIPSDIRQAIHYSISGKISKPKVEHHFSEIKTIINVGKKILGEKIPQGLSGILDQLPF